MSGKDTGALKSAGFWGRLELWKKIVVGMVLGCIVGVVMGPDAVILKPIGTLFINAIKMLIVPLVFFSLIVGVTSMQDTSKMGRIGLKAVLFIPIDYRYCYQYRSWFCCHFRPGRRP